MAWLRSDLLSLREERSAEYVFYPHEQLEAFSPLTPTGHKAADKLLAVAKQVVPAKRGSLFRDWCIADTDLAMMLQRLVSTGHPVPAPIASYARAQFQRPAVVEYRAHARPPYRRAVPML
jgi:glutathione S-transferase